MEMNRKPLILKFSDYLVDVVIKGMERMLGPSYLSEFTDYDIPNRGKNREELLRDACSEIECIAYNGLND